MLVAVAMAGLAGRVGAASLPPLEIQARTESFVYYSRGEHRVDVEKSERFLRKVEDHLGHETAGPTAYYRVDHAAVVQAKTGLYSDGATDLRDGTIVSVREYDPHEIVHRVAAEIGNPGLFFHEGLAVALGDRGRVQGKKAGKLARAGLRRATFDSFLHRFDRSAEAYAVAGAFVEFLLDEYGGGALREFFESNGHAGRPSPEAFQRVFGASLDEAADRWQASL
jgi:hypothetical protein